MTRIHCGHKKITRKPLLRELCIRRTRVLAYVKKKRASMNKKDWSKYDYPACIVAGRILSNKKSIFTDRSSKTQQNHYINTRFLNTLIYLGGFGGKYGSEGNRIGYCAEQRLAATILKVHPACSVSDLEFSPTVRPRTAKVIPYCSNCKSIFPQL